MSEDKNAAEVATFFDHFKSRECFAKTHLGVPEHLISFLELLEGFVDSFALFRPENYRRIIVGYLRCMERFSSLFNSGYSKFGGCQIATEPLVSPINIGEYFAFDTAAKQHIMHLFVIESENSTSTDSYRYFGVQKFVGYSGSLGILVNAGFSRFVKSRAAGR